MSPFENFSAEAQILSIFVYMVTHSDTKSGKNHDVQRRNKEKETLQHCCRGESTGKEETSEGNSGPALCSNETKITNGCVIKAIVRALLHLDTSAASVAYSIVDNIRQAF